MNGTWWTLGAVGILAAVGTARRRGSGARWKVDVTGRGLAGRSGEFFFELDSSKFPVGKKPPWNAYDPRIRWTTEREAAGEHAEGLAQSGVEPREGWKDWETEDDEYEYQAEETFLIPSIRNLKDKP